MVNNINAIKEQTDTLQNQLDQATNSTLYWRRQHKIVDEQNTTLRKQLARAEEAIDETCDRLFNEIEDGDIDRFLRLTLIKALADIKALGARG